MKKLLIIAFLLLLSVYAFAESYEESVAARIKDYDDLVNAKKISFTVEKGFSGKWVNGKLKTSSQQWPADKGGVFTIDDIDLNNKTATMIGQNGQSKISAYQTSSGLHFTESSSWGSPLYLTVFSKRISTTKYVFVYSRHMKIMEDPLPSQWYGTCEILESY